MAISTNQTQAVVAQPEQLRVAVDLYGTGDFGACLVEVARYVREGVQLGIRIPALLRQASCYSELGRYSESLATLNVLESFVERGTARQRSHFHGQRAHVKKKLGDADAALIEYEAARFWAQEAGEEMTEAFIRNNLAKIYSECGRMGDAIIESDAAIQTAKKHAEQVSVGRFYDQRAQILIDHKDYVGAVNYSESAIRLLSDHPSLNEAKATHGRALIGLGVCYLEQDDPFASLRARRDAVKLIQTSPDDDLIKSALARSNGRVLQAAQLLGMRHFALSKMIQTRKIERQSIRRRGRPTVQK